jgi:hypothetical protein
MNYQPLLGMIPMSGHDRRSNHFTPTLRISAWVTDQN